MVHAGDLRHGGRVTVQDPSVSKTPAPSASLWRSAGYALAIALGCFTVFGLVTASQIKLSSAAFGRDVPWPVALTAGLMDSLVWVPLGLPIAWLARRFALPSDRWPLHLGVLATGALVATLTYGTVHATATEYLVPESLQIGRFWRPRPPTPPEGPREGGAVTVPQGAPGTSRETVPHSEGPRDRRSRGRGRESDPSGSGFWDRARFVVTTRWHMHLLIYSAIVGVVHWTRQQQHLREREAQARELSRQLTEARLHALRMQLNPHFLFNTLNAIATLVHRSPQAADEMISSLSDFLRLTLNSDNRPQSTLDREIEFARRYLDIERARFGERLVFRELVEPACLSCLVPTLVLQPLLENAVRHGIEPLERPGMITLQAARKGDHLVVAITDTGAGLAPKNDGRTGIGLANTRQRLHELHGHAASLELRDALGGGLCVELRIPWSIMPPTPEPTPTRHAPARPDRR